MAMQIGTTRHASLLRLVRRASPVTGTARRRGIDGVAFALGEGLPSGGLAGTGEEDDGGRVPAADGAM